ncbi:MAG: hypothetical protein K2N72_08090 [Oscillospiraceae bacterium]|nr:hypothetical protein [Oscillospiraceae bacterium]
MKYFLYFPAPAAGKTQGRSIWLAPKRRLEINDLLRREMIEIFSGMNIFE